MLKELFAAYEELAAKADAAFQRVAQEHRDLVRCRLRCAECCHAIFGLFLIESVYLKHHFEQLDAQTRQAVLQNAAKADRALADLERSLKEHLDDAQMQAQVLAHERIRCPLLSDQDECLLYPVRPITCRVYGIPVTAGGQTFVCGQTGFERGQPYPTFDLDAVYRDLHRLSKEVLKSVGCEDEERASLLLSVAKSIKLPLEDLIRLPR